MKLGIIGILLKCMLPCLSSGFGIVDHQLLSSFSHTTLSNNHNELLPTNIVASATTIANPLSPVFEKYMTTLSQYPLPTKMLTGAALATAGDAIAQGREDDDYDPSRGASFAAFDSIYRAAQHWLFPIIVELCQGQYLFSSLGAIGAAKLFDLSILTAMERSLASQLIIVPFLYYPVFFTFTGYMQGLTLEEGIERAKQNFIPLMKRNLLFWIPVQYVQFCYIPTDLQIPFLSCAGLAWTFLLSVLAGSAKKYSNDEPDHETYCVIGTETECIIPEEELFPTPVMFNDFDENDLSGVALRASKEEPSTTIEEKEKLIMK
ncbi:hypothetical protein ACHAWC_002741 [Mediolabrus comicus]